MRKSTSKNSNLTTKEVRKVTTKKSYKQSLVWAIAMIALLAIAFFVPVGLKFVCVFLAGFCFNEGLNWFINPVNIIVSRPRQPVDMPNELEDYDEVK